MHELSDWSAEQVTLACEEAVTGPKSAGLVTTR